MHMYVTLGCKRLRIVPDVMACGRQSPLSSAVIRFERLHVKARMSGVMPGWEGPALMDAGSHT
jgi:hypothetical protein